MREQPNVTRTAASILGRNERHENMAPSPPMLPSERKKNHHQIRQQASFWPTAMPIDHSHDQHLKILSTGGDDDDDDGSRLIVRGDNGELVAFLENNKAQSATTKGGKNTTTTTLDSFDIWADRERTVLIGLLNEVPATQNPSVPAHLRRERQYRMYSSKPMYPGQAKIRRRRRGGGGQVLVVDDQEKSSNIRAKRSGFDVMYHCADIASRPSGLFGRQQNHHLKFHLDEPKCWTHYSSMTNEDDHSTVVRRERKCCAEATRRHKNDIEQGVWVTPGSDPVVICLFLAITGSAGGRAGGAGVAAGRRGSKE